MNNFGILAIGNGDHHTDAAPLSAKKEIACKPSHARDLYGRRMSSAAAMAMKAIPMQARRDWHWGI